jgi:hypothetical protein
MQFLRRLESSEVQDALLLRSAVFRLGMFFPPGKGQFIKLNLAGASLTTVYLAHLNPAIIQRSCG